MKVRIPMAALAACFIAFAQGASKLEERAAQLASSESKQKAEPVLAEAVAKNPNDAESMLLLGLVRESLGADTTEIAKLYEKAREVLETRATAEPENMAAALELQARWIERNMLRGDVNEPRTRAAAIRRKLAEQSVAAIPAPANPLRIGGQVAAPRLTSKEEPSYSNLARLTATQGAVVLTIVVDTTGRPAGIRVLRSLGFGLDEMAVRAVERWQFSPAKRGDEAVPVQATVEVNFRLL